MAVFLKYGKNMLPLEKSLRNRLERTIKEARDVAEAAATASLEQLGVGEAAPFAHLSADERELRRKLRVHGRQLGDSLLPSPSGRGAGGEGKIQTMDRLIEEVGYEHWHRMLFARFLAENNLLMYDGVAVTLEECAELAADEGLRNEWELAARLATAMLPQIFRPEAVVFSLHFPPEHQQRLERLVAELPAEVFSASDSLGWVYQFWQAKRKEAVNASEVKIGARELPAVTQLFTEPYMVALLLDNSLGAWWAARRLTEKDYEEVSTEYTESTEIEKELRRRASIPGVPLEYLRFVKVEAASSRFPDAGENASSHLKEFGYFHKDDEIANLSGNLPHWRQDDVTYFVTFRTADSLPQEKLKLWQAEKDEWLKQHPEPHDEKTKREFYEKFPDRIQKWLDQGHGACIPGTAEYNAIIENALRFFDGDRYGLDEFVVMPNHVHAIVTPKNGHALSDILHSWKSFTASEINKRTGKNGAFWQKESFDHIVRSPEQLERIRAYIRNHSSHKGKRQDAASTLIWTSAAGTFDNWPESLSELKTLDPCCGSGHFLVAAFLMLVPMRRELENLSAREAVDAVLRDNIHGLELDRRCVELAAFALALTAWRYPNLPPPPSPSERGASLTPRPLGEGPGVRANPIGYRPLPELHLACSGLSVSVAKEEWKQLALDKHNLRIALDWMHDAFKDAPVLGSLLNPARTDAARLVEWPELSAALEQALNREQTAEQQEAAVVAQGLTKAASLLAGKYHWVITNVPYLARGKQEERLRDFCEKHYPAAKNDLATVFLERCLELCVEAPSRRLDQAAKSRLISGTVSVVLPQNWLFLTSYRKFREQLLKQESWHLIARLGPGAFSTPMWDFNVQLITLSRGNAHTPALSRRARGQESLLPPREGARRADEGLIRGLDVSEPRTAADKAAGLLTAEIKQVEQAKQLENPDARVAFEDVTHGELLKEYATAYWGQGTGDFIRFGRFHWEICPVTNNWEFGQTTIKQSTPFSGRLHLVYWQKGEGELVQLAEELKHRLKNIHYRGAEAWGKKGVSVTLMQNLKVTIYTGEIFDGNCASVVPHNPAHLPAIWCFCSSPEYNEAVRRIDQKLNVTNATLVKIPFDLDHWTKIAAEKYPHGLPKPYSDDPTQWIFHGHPCGSVVWDEATKWTTHGPLRSDDTVLQVAVARLLGYRWPAELESRSGFQPLEDKSQDGSSTMELSPEARAWVQKSAALLPYADDDGIVCIPPVRGEMSACDRLENLLAAAYGPEWSAAKKSELLAQADHAGKTLETWLREKFFSQHCKLFQHRPFIWHVWDGLRDGFAALINYHKLDHKLLETLIYTYLGDWISRQKQDQATGVDGAREKLAAAESLKKKLELILEGEAPYDIFIRWKPLAGQPIGWHPDLNDGVRLNIRPFLAVPDVAKKGTGILRDKPNIKWEKDRGKDVESAPWYHAFGGDRINDHHLSLDEKRAAREKEE